MRWRRGEPAWRPAARRAARAILAATLAAALAGTAAAQRLVAVRPVLVDSVLACRLETAGLPGPRLEQALASGLTSALVAELELRRGDGRTLARRRWTLRIGFDLWDGTYAVSWGGHRRVLAGADSLRAWLRTPPPLPVAAPSRLRLAADTELRLRASLTLLPIAPDERARLAGVVSGEGGKSTDRREATVGVDRLIRLFFRGRDAPSPLSAVSPPFTLREVRR